MKACFLRSSGKLPALGAAQKAEPFTSEFDVMDKSHMRINLSRRGSYKCHNSTMQDIANSP